MILKINMICAIYTRKSKQDDNSQSMEAQLDMCKNYIYTHYKGAKIVVYDKDYGITGHSIKNRKDFQRLMKDVKSGLINVVLVQRYDRLARNTRDFCNVYHEMEQVNCTLVAVSQNIDTSTPYGRNFMYQMASMAELEWALNSQRHKDVNAYAASIGKCNVSIAPVGYKIEKVDGVRKMVIDEKTKPIIEDMINYLSSGGSRSSVIKYINDKYNTNYTYNLFRTFSRSTFYTGIYRNNNNFCPAYLTKEKHEKLTEQKPIHMKTGNHVSFFTSMIRCPLCGYCLSSSHNNEGTPRVYYRCQLYIKSHNCMFNLCVSQKKVEKYLIENIETYLNDLLISVEIKNKEKPKKTNIKKYESELKRLNNLYIKGRLEEDEYEKKYFDLQNLINAEKEESNSIDVENLVTKFPSNWKEVYFELTDINKKRFWLSTIKEIKINEKKEVTKIIFL